MRRPRQPVSTANSLLRVAISQASAVPALTGALLIGLAPAGQALTLGDLSVHSTLGQRLDATVPVRLASGESLAGTCVVPGRQGPDLRHVPGARVSAPQAAREGRYELRVTSDAALYEPMYELELRVQCPGAPIVVRQYVLMLDLPGAVAAGVVGPAMPMIAQGDSQPVAVDQAQTAAPSTSRQPAVRRPAGKIDSGSRYRVAEGDTLSAIAARVQGRTVSLQSMADAIQAANPGAFIRNDANLIKLGSEITIPGPVAAVPAVAAAPESAPAPAQPAIAPEPTAPTTAVVAPVPQPPVPVPAPQPTVAEPTAAPTVDVAVAAPVPQRTKPALAATSPDAEPATAAPDEANPVVAAGAGILFGLLVSTFLWFRGRLPARKRPAPAITRPDMAPPAPEPAAFATQPAPLVTRAAEPGFSVSFTPAHEDALAAEFAEPEPTRAPAAMAPRLAPPQAPIPSEDITSELEELFDSTDTTIQKRLNAEKTVAARAFASAPDDFMPVAAADGEVDFPVGDPTGEEELLGAGTIDQPRPNLEPTAQSATVDLRSLATSATKDQQQAQTLLEALTLLERDYEEELTASQVLDMSAVRDALGDDLDEPTQISAARLREVSGRKKSR